MSERSRAEATATAEAGIDGAYAANSIRIVSGRITVIGTGTAVGGLSIEVNDVSSGRSIASGSTDRNGQFNIRICVNESSGWFGRHRPCPIDIQIIVLAPERPSLCRDERVLFCSEIRRKTLCIQEFLIELPSELVAKAELSSPDSPVSVEAHVQKMQTRRETAKKITQARNEFLQEDLVTAEEQSALFRDKIGPKLVAEQSRVTKRETDSKEFVPADGDVESIQLKSAVKDVEDLTGDLPDKKMRGTTLLLTEAEKIALIGDATDVVEKTEEEIEEELGLSMDKPSIIDRKNMAMDSCLPQMDVDACLSELLDLDEQQSESEVSDNDVETEPSGENGEGEGDGVIVLSGDLESNGNGAGNGVSFDKDTAIATLTSRMTAPEDPVEFGVDTGDLEPQLTIDQVSANIANVTFSPGPADVPAFHNFSDLQIAFAPVWQEVLDDRYVQDAEQLYNKYVEKGGKATFDGFVNLTLTGVSMKAFADLSSTFGTSLEKGYGSVAGFVIITEAEWDSLPGETQDYLSGLASEIKEQRENLRQAMDIAVEDPPAGLSIWELIAWKKQAAHLSAQSVTAREKLRLLKSDADEVVAIARRLLLEKEAKKPFAPTHAIVEALKSRARKAYPFRPFAASSTHRSVNFGILVTYQQIWTPKSYQVGELVKTIPMAPKEERTYKRRTVEKKKSSIKKIESIFERTTGETQETGRLESEILRRATAKTNFDYQNEGEVNYGTGEKAGFNVKGSQKTGFKRDVEKHSKSVKKEFNEQVRKATQEVKNEQKTEIETEESFEEEFTETGKLLNPNDEIPCTFLFYELQRRYQVEERINQLQSVILVAQEVPRPTEVDKAWLISHDWILSRVLLDPSFAPALGYLSTSLISDEVALTEMRKALFNQRKLVEEIKEDLADRRVSAGLRYGALQKQIERSAKKAEGGGGFFGGLKKIAGGIPGVGGIVESGLDLITGGGDDVIDPATELRERAARDAFDRERQEEQSLEGRVSGAISTLSRIESEYTEKLSGYLTQLGQCNRLIDHVVDNILYYMQAIWAHEPRDQMELRLRHVKIPVFEKVKSFKKYAITTAAVKDISQLASTKFSLADVKIKNPGMKIPPPAEQIEMQDLFEVADLGQPLGVWANYLIFPMLESNVITEYMMEPYVTLAEKEYGVTDPDVLGNMTLAEFSEYVCCLKKESEKQKAQALEGDDVGIVDLFEEMKPELRKTLKKLLERAGPDGRDIVVPMDGLYIEALPGTHSVMERFKHLHRQIDVKKAQADVRDIELDNVRQAERISKGILDDPDVEKTFVVDSSILEGDNGN